MNQIYGQQHILTEFMIYISFIEEAILNPDYTGYIGGRIEVHHPEDRRHHSEEIRFFTKDVEAFNVFRDEWDMRDVTNEELDFIRDIVKERWCNK